MRGAARLISPNYTIATLKMARYVKFFRVANESAARPVVQSSMTRPARLSSAADTAGFTLLELAVVMFLMGLIMMIAMPYFGSLQPAQLRSESRRLASRANYLYQEAGAQKVLIRLTFDLDYNGYFVTRLDPFAIRPAFMPEGGPAGVRVLLPVGVRIRDVWVEGIGTLTRGQISTQFYPSGYVDATVLHLVDDQGEVFTIAFDPFTGRVSIRNGDLAPPRRGAYG